MNIDLKDVLESRLVYLKNIVTCGQIPGIMDKTELDEMKGRVKELKLVLDLWNGKLKVA
jgi:hypothetical protein